jgi:CDP-diacylglycerol--glycerol-3-phosphate 3-phosphatidyltransferase
VNLPNSLTLLRVLMIPVMVLIFFSDISGRYLIAAAIFGAAAITDWLDGYLARRLGQGTSFGAFLDPVADKLMVSVAIIILIHELQSVPFTIAGCVIIAREIVVSALREWMAEIGERTSVRVSWLGKVKTTVQMISITVLLAIDPMAGGSWMLLMLLGYALFMVAAVLTVWSMLLYLLAARKAVQNSESA